MRKKHILCTFLVFMCFVFTLGISAFATNDLVPYSPGGQDVSSSADSVESDTGTSSGVHDYAGELFLETKIEETEAVTNMITAIANVASWLITLVLGTLTSILTIIMVIDICCLLIKPLAGLLAKLPIQVFSDEICAITGIQYTGNTEGASTGTIEKVDLKGKPAFLYYLEKKALLIIPAVIILILLGTGLLFDGVFFVANNVVSWVAGLLG